MKDFKGDKASELHLRKRFNNITGNWEEGVTTESLINYFIKHDTLPNHDYLINETKTIFEIEETPPNIDMGCFLFDEEQDDGFSLIEAHEHSSEYLFYFNRAKKQWFVFDQFNSLKYDLDTEGVIAFINEL